MTFQNLNETLSKEAAKAEAKAMEIFASRVSQPLQWGENDCCLALADTVAPVWGFDPVERFRGRYNSRTGFLRLLKKEDCQSLEELTVKLATEIGARPFEAETPENFDLGFVYAGNPAGQALVINGLPAFFYQGLWVGITVNGMIGLPEAAFMWRQPQKAGA